MSMVSREFPARLINVHDGDTVRCDIDLGFAVSLSNVSCRLLGINAPELKAPGGVEAKEHLIKLLANVEHMAITASPADWRDK